MGTRAYKMMKFSSITSLAAIASPVCLFVFFIAGAGGLSKICQQGGPISALRACEFFWVVSVLPTESFFVHTKCRFRGVLKLSNP